MLRFLFRIGSSITNFPIAKAALEVAALSRGFQGDFFRYKKFRNAECALFHLLSQWRNSFLDSHRDNLYKPIYIFFGEHKEQITNKNEINKCDFKISRS